MFTLIQRLEAWWNKVYTNTYMQWKGVNFIFVSSSTYKQTSYVFKTTLVFNLCFFPAKRHMQLKNRQTPRLGFVFLEVLEINVWREFTRALEYQGPTRKKGGRSASTCNRNRQDNETYLKIKQRKQRNALQTGLKSN